MIGPALSTNPLFWTSVDLVVLPVTVTDSHQQYVAGLTMADFHVYEDSTLQELVPMYGVIGEELARQYTLAYKSTNPRLDGAFRRIAVRLPSQPGARPRTRLGYLAPRVSRATREAQ